MTGCRDSSPSNDHQGDTPYCLHMGWAQKWLTICTRYLIIRGWGKYTLQFYFFLKTILLYKLSDLNFARYTLQKVSTDEKFSLIRAMIWCWQIPIITWTNYDESSRIECVKYAALKSGKSVKERKHKYIYLNFNIKLLHIYSIAFEPYTIWNCSLWHPVNCIFLMKYQPFLCWVECPKQLGQYHGS